MSPLGNVLADVIRPLPRLHLVTDDATLLATDFAERAEQLLIRGSGRVALHLRGPSLSGRLLFDIAARLVPIARASGALLLLNDRLDVALATDASGVQLGIRSVSPADTRQLLDDRIIGASVHSREEAERAIAGGADFLLVGTLFPTPSHPDHPGAGLDLLRELHPLGTPLIGIGGITPARVPQTVAAGAHGVAVLRGVWNAEEPLRAMMGYLDALQTCSPD